MGLFFGAINVSLVAHLVHDVGHPTCELLDSDVVDWVVQTPTVAHLTPASAVT